MLLKASLISLSILITSVLNFASDRLVTYRGILIILSADFSKATLQTRRDWQEIFKVIQSRDQQPRLLYPAKLSLRIKGQRESFPDKTKTKGVPHHQIIIT